MAQCKHIKQDGSQCEASATTNSTLCFTHNPKMHKAKILAITKGGLNRKHYEAYGESLILDHPSDIKRLLADTINGVWTGKIPASQPANTIGFLARCWIDVNQSIEFEDRLDALELKLKQLKV